MIKNKKTIGDVIFINNKFQTYVFTEDENKFKHIIARFQGCNYSKRVMPDKEHYDFEHFEIHWHKRNLPYENMRGCKADLIYAEDINSHVYLAMMTAQKFDIKVQHI